MKTLPRVAVTWIDAHYDPSQYEDCDLADRDTSFTVNTVGHLLAKTKDHIILATEVFSTGSKRYTHSIPLAMVKKLEYWPGDKR